MANHKGHPKSGGRKKGVPNVRTKVMKTFEELCNKYGIDPLEVKFRGLRLKPPKRANFEQKMQVHEFVQKVATDTAPYGHAKMAQVEVKGPGVGGAHLGINLNMNANASLDPSDPKTLEVARRIAFVLAQGVREQKKLAVSADKPQDTGEADQ